MRLGSMPFSDVRYPLVLTARCCARRTPPRSSGSTSPTMTAFASGSRCRRRATSSRMPLASLSTRHGFAGLRAKLISFSLLAVGGGGGGGGGWFTVTVVVVLLFRPRSSVAVAVTVIAPGCAPVVSSVAVLPLGVSFPALDWKATVTGRLSGLVAVQVIVEFSPGFTVVGFAVQEMVGGFLGCSFTEKLALQLVVSPFFPELMFAVTV